MEAEVGVRNVNRHQKLERQRKDPTLEPQRESSPSNPLDLDFWPPKQ